MTGAASGEREAPRTERTNAGEYVPVRTGQTRAPTVRPGTEGTTLARPDLPACLSGKISKTALRHSWVLRLRAGTDDDRVHVRAFG